MTLLLLGAGGVCMSLHGSLLRIHGEIIVPVVSWLFKPYQGLMVVG